jgi:DNA-binding NarL/FixJ family response regulator
MSLHPRLVIMDINMPHMDGLRAASLIREQCSETTVVLMSAEDSPCLRQQCRACGAHAFIPKTNLRNELAGVLQELAAGAQPQTRRQ